MPRLRLDLLSAAFYGLGGRIPVAEVRRIAGGRPDSQADHEAIGRVMREGLGYSREIEFPTAENPSHGKPVSYYVRGDPAERAVPIWALFCPITGNLEVRVGDPGDGPGLTKTVLVRVLPAR
jgi:hypothetical protein